MSSECCEETLPVAARAGCDVEGSEETFAGGGDVDCCFCQNRTGEGKGDENLLTGPAAAGGGVAARGAIRGQMRR